VVEDRISAARHEPQSMALQNRVHLDAPVGQKAGWTCLDRTLAQLRGFSQNPIGIELVTPARDIAHPPRCR